MEQANEDKRYFIKKLEDMNKILAELKYYLEELKVRV